MKRQRKGFTLVELAIVIAILGILAVVAIPKYQGMVDEARSAAAKAQLGTVRSAIAIYYAKHQGAFPATIDADLFADGNIAKVEITNTDGDVISSADVLVVNTVGDIPFAVGNITTDGGWVYNNNTGEVRINHTATDPVTGGAAWWTY